MGFNNRSRHNEIIEMMKSRTSRVVSNNNRLKLERLLVSTYYHLLQLRIVYLQALNHILFNIISESIAIKSFDFSTVGWTPAFSLSYRQGMGSKTRQVMVI